MKYFNISIDCDEISRYSNGYFNSNNENITFEKALPRSIDLFEKYKIQATFFITGEEASRKPGNKLLIRRLYDAGHEIANHTYHHYYNFSRLPFKKKEEEILSCQKLLEDITGDSVLGYRAPCYDVDEDTLTILHNNGYLYDSSIYPVYFKFLQQIGYYMWNVFHGQAAGKWRKIGKFKHCFFPPEPQSIKVGNNGNKLFEIPIPTAGPLRFPFYSTLIFQFGLKYFSKFYPRVKNYNFFTFELHSIDFIDYIEDSISEHYGDLKFNPCMKISNEEKLLIFYRIFDQFMEDYKPITLRKFTEHMLNCKN